jgi:hypothetical protein
MASVVEHIDTHFQSECDRTEKKHFYPVVAHDIVGCRTTNQRQRSEDTQECQVAHLHSMAQNRPAQLSVSKKSSIPREYGRERGEEVLAM